MLVSAYTVPYTRRCTMSMLQHSTQTGTEEATKLPYYYVVQTNSTEEAKEASILRIPRDATHIHFDGFPFLNILKRLLDLLPLLEEVRIAPAQEATFGAGSKALLQERNIRICFGCKNKTKPWDEGEVRHPNYEKNRKFFFKLSRKQWRQLQELLRCEIFEAKLAKRYFCLEGEPYIPLRELKSAVTGKKEQTNLSFLSTMIHATIAYLDPNLPVPKTVARQVLAIKYKLEQIRKQRGRLKKSSEEFKYLHSLGITSIPYGLPLTRAALYKAVKELHEHRRLHELLSTQKHVDVLLYRFGLKDMGKGYVVYSLSEIGKHYGVSAASIQQHEKRTLARLKKLLPDFPKVHNE